MDIPGHLCVWATLGCVCQRISFINSSSRFSSDNALPTSYVPVGIGMWPGTGTALLMGNPREKSHGHAEKDSKSVPKVIRSARPRPHHRRRKARSRTKRRASNLILGSQQLYPTLAVSGAAQITDRSMSSIRVQCQGTLNAQ